MTVSGFAWVPLYNIMYFNASVFCYTVGFNIAHMWLRVVLF